MNLYSIQKGKHISKGVKEQPIYYQIFCFVIGISLSVLFSSMTLGFITFLACMFLNITLSSSIDVQSKRVYFLPPCAFSEEKRMQTNIIYGFASGYKKWNSASIGWRGLGNGTIEIIAFCYVNGKKIEKSMVKCKVQSWVFLHIENKYRKYVFKAMTHNGKHSIVSIQKGSLLSIYTLFSIFIYKLYPRFEGLSPAPMDMKLYMKKLASE